MRLPVFPAANSKVKKLKKEHFNNYTYFLTLKVGKHYSGKRLTRQEIKVRHGESPLLVDNDFVVKRNGKAEVISEGVVIEKVHKFTKC